MMNESNNKNKTIQKYIDCKTFGNDHHPFDVSDQTGVSGKCNRERSTKTCTITFEHFVLWDHDWTKSKSEQINCYGSTGGLYVFISTDFYNGFIGYGRYINIFKSTHHPTKKEDCPHNRICKRNMKEKEKQNRKLNKIFDEIGV